METRGIAEGMAVRASDGKKVGTVIECRTDGFVIEKGVLFPRDYAVAYGEVQDIADGEVHLRRASDELERVGRGRDEAQQGSTGEAPVTREEVSVEHAPVQGARPADEGAFEEKTIAIPVREDEVEIRKRPVVREEVRVSKVRQRGEQRADAEVRHEEARVERSPDSPEPGPWRGEPEDE